MINDEDSKSLNSKEENIEILNSYVEYSLSAFNNLKDNKYDLALDNFQACVDYANNLDDIKKAESLSNKGICLYFCGNFDESYEELDQALKISSKIYHYSSNLQIKQ